MSINKKVHSIFTLMKVLVEKKSVRANDKELAEELGYDSTRTLSRHLEDISQLYPEIIKVRQKEGNIYQLVDVSYIFQKIISTTDDLYWLIELVDKWDSSILGNLSERVSNKEKDIFLYKNSPFEELQTDKQKEIFRQLQIAIMDKRYQNIHYTYDKPRVHHQALCLKLVFMEQNWYVAIVDKESGLRFLRIAFITNLSPSSKHDASREDTTQYDDFFKTFQNSMTKFGNTRETAYIKASKYVAKYFKKDMKPFFESQQFIKESKDGSIEFSIEYTQAMEILPFIKRWLPDLEILSPKTLDEQLKADITRYLNKK